MASKLGVGAIDALINGERTIMVGIHHQKVVSIPLEVAITNGAKYDKNLRRVADITSV